MPAYWVARANVRDVEGLKKYSEILRRIVPAHPYETLARGGQIIQLEGARNFEQHYLHQFPSVEAALAFYNTPEYQEAAKIRRAACDGCELVILEGKDLLRA